MSETYTSTALAAAKKTCETLRAAAEKAETAAQEAEIRDCEAWARYGGSHTDPPPGKGPLVVKAKAVAKAAADAADRAQEAYDDLLARAS